MARSALTCTFVDVVTALFSDSQQSRAPPPPAATQPSEPVYNPETMVAPRVEERIRELPDRPGIYMFKSAETKPLYIGKAKSLRKRAVAYLRDPQDERLQRMLAEATDLDYLIADTEAEALGA